jgi:hypothetical protein
MNTMRVIGNSLVQALADLNLIVSKVLTWRGAPKGQRLPQAGRKYASKNPQPMREPSRYHRTFGLDAGQLDELEEYIEGILPEHWNKGRGRPKSLSLREAIMVTHALQAAECNRRSDCRYPRGLPGRHLGDHHRIQPVDRSGYRKIPA